MPTYLFDRVPGGDHHDDVLVAMLVTMLVTVVITFFSAVCKKLCSPLSIHIRDLQINLAFRQDYQSFVLITVVIAFFNFED